MVDKTSVAQICAEQIHHRDTNGKWTLMHKLVRMHVILTAINEFRCAHHVSGQVGEPGSKGATKNIANELRNNAP